jgi:hypothetical protein
MNFAERNAEWTGRRRQFQQLQTRAKKPGYWAIEVSGPTITVWWGRLGSDKIQCAPETVGGVNIGKANEKSPSQYALERAREMTRKKSEYEGYREFITTDTGGAFLDPIIEGQIDFDDLPPTLSFYKPDNTMGSRIEKLARAGMAWYTRKRNGMAKVLCSNTRGELSIYSRRMLRQHDDEIGSDFTWDDRFAHIIGAIQPHIPPKTILLGELVVEENGVERFDIAQSYIKSLTPKAVAEMEQSGLWPFFYCWDVAFWNGVDLVKAVSMRERFLRIGEIASNVVTKSRVQRKVFEPLHASKFASPEEAVAFAKANGWEGFVVIDPEAQGYGDKAYNFSGKPHRPGTACAKLKPSFEDDFVAIWDPDKGYGERSTKSSRGGGIKSVGLYQYNKAGELVFIANCNSGLTDEFIEANSNPKLYPQVWKVEYKGRRYVSDGDDTNALDFPAFIEARSDKRPNECVNERL